MNPDEVETLIELLGDTSDARLEPLYARLIEAQIDAAEGPVE